MFLVSDTREERSKKIRSLIDIDVEIAVLVAASDFEWTCRRCILALGKSPTKYIREEVLKGATISKYPKKWNEEVYPMCGKHLGDVLPNFAFKGNSAFDLRNKIIHGEFGKIKFDQGKDTVEEIIAASEKLSKFAEERNQSIYKVIRRYKSRIAIYN